MDHDQRFKELIKTFFVEFFCLFFLKWAGRLETEKADWVDKEAFPDPPDGPRRTLDLVAKIPTRQVVPGIAAGEAESWLVLVHIEIESPDRARPLRQRMQRSYGYLREKYGLPVLPIALCLRVGLDGVGIDVYEEDFWELDVLRFKYLYVGLPALDAIEYVQGDNWLGVALAALMRIPKERAAWLGAEALRRIKEAPLSDQRRFLLGECVQAYLPLDDEQVKEFEQLMASEPYQGIRTMNTTWYEKGLIKGLEQGLEQGKEQALRKALLNLLEKKFGPISAGTRGRIEILSATELEAHFEEALSAESLSAVGLDG